MVSASLCVGLTLPGMMDEPGSFSGMLNSPMPLRGPLASQRTSLAIFIRLAASVLSAPWAWTSASHDGHGLELVRRGDERQAGQPRQLGRHLFGVALGRVQPGADGGAAQRQFAQMRQRGAHMRLAMRQLRHVARELLAQRQRRRVLQMGAADLHDVVKVAATFCASVARSFSIAGSSLFVMRDDRRHMHRRGKHVVATTGCGSRRRSDGPAGLRRARRPAARWRGWPAPR